MILSVAPNLEKLTVLAEEAEQETILGALKGTSGPLPVWTFADPVLMTDTSRIGQLPAGLRDALFALHESYPRTVTYDGVSVSWTPQRYPRVWGPSIDTIFLAQAVKPYLPAARSAVEVGCGSGFITKFMIQHGQLDRVLASDINLQALQCCSDALAEIEHDAAVSLVAPQPGDPTLGFSGTFDLMVSNPPYIPRPNERNDNPYEGLDLVAKFARQGQQVLNPGGVLLLNISSLSGDRPERWLADEGWAVRETARKTVPLKVNAVTSGVTPESRAWLAYLRDRGAVPADGEHRGYQFWHDLRILECRPPRS